MSDESGLAGGSVWFLAVTQLMEPSHGNNEKFSESKNYA